MAKAKSVRRKPAKTTAKNKSKLLSGDNPQTAKGLGSKPVKNHIAAMPGWKKKVGQKLDVLFTDAIPDVQKAIKWNTPFYRREGEGWYVAFHCLTKYIKIAFFKGTSLKPLPPESSKQENVRYFHIYEGDEIDETLIRTWVEQASRLPGEKL